METETKVIPISRLDSLEKLNESLAVLVAKGDSIEVYDPATDLQAKQFKVECESYFTAVDLLTDGEIQDLRERTTNAVAAKKALLAPVLRVFETVNSKRKLWEEAERVAAAKESKELGVEVKPSIPTLAGVPSTRRYKVAVENEEVILLEWVKARKNRDKALQHRAMFLQSYIRIDEKAIQAVARSEKGWNELKAQKIPGLKMWTE